MPMVMNEKSEAEVHAMEEGSNNVVKKTNTRPSALFRDIDAV